MGSSFLGLLFWVFFFVCWTNRVGCELAAVGAAVVAFGICVSQIPRSPLCLILSHFELVVKELKWSWKCLKHVFSLLAAGAI